MTRVKFSTLWLAILTAASLMVLPISANAATHSPPLAALAQTLPAARSGQTYLWKLKVEGGTPPYHCVPKSLDLGTLALRTTCEITGTAPVVSSESITGPFHFKVQDSSSPKKTAEFPSMNFTVLPAKATVPEPPAGFKLDASATADPANGWLAVPDNLSINNPLGVDIRVTGTGHMSTSADLICAAGLSTPEVKRTFNGTGLFVLPVPTGASNCDTIVTTSGTSGDFTVQVYAQTGAATTTTTTPPITTGSTTTTTKPTTTTTVKGAPWYQHINCNEQVECISSTGQNLNALKVVVGGSASPGTEADCESWVQSFYQVWTGNLAGPTSWCDQNPSATETGPAG